MALQRQRVLADEQRFVALEAEHHVARANAGDAKIGVNLHDRRVPMRARLGVPAGAKRRVEFEPMARDLDGGDDRLGGASQRRESFGHGGSVSWNPFSRQAAEERGRGGCWAAHLYAVQIVLKSMYLSIACGDRSRPKPDCLKPPNGVVSDERS